TVGAGFPRPGRCRGVRDDAGRRRSGLGGALPRSVGQRAGKPRPYRDVRAGPPRPTGPCEGAMPTFKYEAMDTSGGEVKDAVESGSTLSEAFAKHPRCFDRLYVNMVKAGEAGGALEIILKRLAEFKEKAQTLKRRITGAMVYPVVVVLVAVCILTFIMIFI